jgi:hypothetical protein
MNDKLKFENPYNLIFNRNKKLNKKEKMDL